MEASLIFSMASLIFSAFAWAAGSSRLLLFFPLLVVGDVNFRFKLFLFNVLLLLVLLVFVVLLLLVLLVFPFNTFWLLSLPELLDVLSQNAESLSGLSVRFCCCCCCDCCCCCWPPKIGKYTAELVSELIRIYHLYYQVGVKIRNLKFDTKYTYQSWTLIYFVWHFLHLCIGVQLTTGTFGYFLEMTSLVEVEEVELLVVVVVEQLVVVTNLLHWDDDDHFDHYDHY